MTPDERPQPWDTVKAAQAIADARELVDALSSDATGDEYRRVLESVMTRRLDPAIDMQDLVNRLAYVIYGFTIFGAAAVAVGEAHVGSRERVMAEIERGLDRFLNA